MTSASVKPSEKSPLAGLRFLVTRQDSPESSLSEMLESLGAAVLTVPMTQILQPTSWKSFEENVLNASSVDWVIFTSSNGVKYCMTHLNVLDVSPQKIFSTIKIACVGHATAAALADHGLTPLLVPEHFQSEGLVSAFSKYDLHEKRCWLIQAESPREILRHALEKMGAQILLTPVYRNVPSEGDHSFLLSELQQKNWIGFCLQVHLLSKTFTKFCTMGFGNHCQQSQKLLVLEKSLLKRYVVLVGVFRLSRVFKTLNILFKHFAKSSHKTPN